MRDKTEFLDLGDYKVCYLKAGTGPNLVLLHTLGTQMDIFEKVLPELEREYTVSSFDYPGHGYSDAPNARYDAAFFVKAVEKFLDALDLKDVTLCGVSIGGSLSLLLAAKHNPRVKRVVAINPYDYAMGKGLARSSWVGKMVVEMAKFRLIRAADKGLPPSLGKKILLGGVADPESIPRSFFQEISLTSARKGHTRALLNLLHNSHSWDEARTQYKNIRVPVKVVWGEYDWSDLLERAEDEALLPDAEFVTVKNGGHFLPLDRPDAVIDQLRNER